MTLATQLGVYLFAHRLLGKPAVFPGSKAYWNAVTDATDAGLLAELNTWAALEPKCAGQILNAVNGDVFQWRFIWCVDRSLYLAHTILINRPLARLGTALLPTLAALLPRRTKCSPSSRKQASA